MKLRTLRTVCLVNVAVALALLFAVTYVRASEDDLGVIRRPSPTPGLTVRDSDAATLTVINETGQTLTISIDGGVPSTVIDTVSVPMAAGEHDLVVSNLCGATYPRHESCAAGQECILLISHAPDCNQN